MLKFVPLCSSWDDLSDGIFFGEINFFIFRPNSLRHARAWALIGNADLSFLLLRFNDLLEVLPLP